MTGLEGQGQEVDSPHKQVPSNPLIWGEFRGADRSYPTRSDNHRIVSSSGRPTPNDPIYPGIEGMVRTRFLPLPETNVSLLALPTEQRVELLNSPLGRVVSRMLDSPNQIEQRLGNAAMSDLVSMAASSPEAFTRFINLNRNRDQRSVEVQVAVCIEWAQRKLRLETDRRNPDLNRIADLIAQRGRHPRDQVLAAVRNSSVVGIGHWHGDLREDPNLQFLTRLMPDLARAGVTHLAIEVPVAAQPVLDQWFANRRRNGNFQIPDNIMGADGRPINTPEVRGALSEIRNAPQEEMAFWRAAINNGIRLQAIDNNNEALRNAIRNDPRNPNNREMLRQVSRLTARRDQDMTRNILTILNSRAPGDPPPRVVVLLGSFHIGNNASDNQSAMQGVRQITTRMHTPPPAGRRVTTFLTQVPKSDYRTSWSLTRRVEHPTAISTAIDNVFSRVPWFGLANNSNRGAGLNSFDYLIVFPYREATSRR